MKCDVDRKRLLAGVATVIGSTDRRGIMPILAHILMTVESKSLTLSATDLEISSTQIVKATVDEPGIVAVPGKGFMDILKSLESDVIHLESDGGILKLEAGESKYKFHTIPADQFPPIPPVDVPLTHLGNGGWLLKMIRHNLPAMGMDDLQYHLTGLFFELTEEDGLRVVGTDGHRMSFLEDKSELALSLVSKEGGKALVPRKGILQVVQFIENSQDLELYGSITDKFMVLQAEGRTLMVRINDVKFPDYRRIIPEENGVDYVFNRNELSGALKRLSVLSPDRFKGVLLEMDGTETEISFDHVDVGEGREKVALLWSSGPNRVSFNARYLLDMLAVIDGDEVTMSVRPTTIAKEDGTEVSMINSPATFQGNFPGMVLVMPIDISYHRPPGSRRPWGPHEVTE